MDGVLANTGEPVLLGPEPIIEPQTITLGKVDHPGAVLRLVTDGLAPFALQTDAPAR